MKELISQIIKKLSFTQKQLIYSSIIKCFGVLASLMLSRFLAKVLDVEDFGLFNLFEVILQILVVVGLFGSRQSIVKQVSILFQRGKYKEIESWFKSTIVGNTVISCLVLGIYLIVVSFVFKENLHIRFGFQIGGLVIYFRVLLFILSSFYSSHQKLWQSNLVDRGALPFLLLLALFIYEQFGTLNFIKIFVTYVIVSFVFLIIVLLYWFQFSNPQLTGVKYDYKKILNHDTKNFFLLTSIGLVFTKLDMLSLGVFSTEYNLGIYGPAAKISFLMNFFAPVIHSIYSPRITHLYSSDNISDIKKIFTDATKALFFLGSVQLIFIVLFGKDLLSIWGEEYIAGYTVLIILSAANFMTITFSMCLPIVIMCDQHKKYLNRLFILVIASAICLAFVTPEYGINGVAICMAVSILFDVSIKVNLTSQKIRIFTKLVRVD